MAFLNNVTDTLFADVSEFQVAVDDSYTAAGYQVLSFRSNDGTHVDANFAANYAWAVNAIKAGTLSFFFCYYYWRPGETGLTTHMNLVNGVGGPHPRQVSMIDLESGGNPDSDQSAAVNDEYNQLVTWLGGNDQRVIGYGNQGDLRTMWQFPGHQIDVILAGYGNDPTSPNALLTKVAHQYTDGEDFGDGLPTGVPPFGNCDMNSADGLSVQAFASACGLGVPVPPLPPAPQPPAPTPPPVINVVRVTPIQAQANSPLVTLPTDASIEGLNALLVAQLLGST